VCGAAALQGHVKKNWKNRWFELNSMEFTYREKKSEPRNLRGRIPVPTITEVASFDGDKCVPALSLSPSTVLLNHLVARGTCVFSLSLRVCVTGLCLR
jgi:hypothetical protein